MIVPVLLIALALPVIVPLFADTADRAGVLDGRGSCDQPAVGEGRYGSTGIIDPIRDTTDRAGVGDTRHRAAVRKSATVPVSDPLLVSVPMDEC